MSAADKIQAARALIEPLTGHTDGPWSWQDDEEVLVGPKQVVMRRDDRDPDFMVFVSYRGDGMTEANRAVFAAAPALRDTVADLTDLADAQAQEIAKLRKALGFYANPENWKGDEEAWERAEYGDDDPETLEAMLSSVELDGGKIARDALGDEP